MGFITDARAELVEALSSVGVEGFSHTVKVFDHVPGRVNPPAIFAVHGSPTVEGGDTFGSYKVNFELWVISRLAANSRMTDELDDLLEQTLTALAADGGWVVGEVQQPFLATLGSESYLASVITVSSAVQVSH